MIVKDRRSGTILEVTNILFQRKQLLKEASLHRIDKGASGQELPEGDWLYEIKYDGYRALASKMARMSG
jgi:ATP-dependent DNA ligase